MTSLQRSAPESSAEISEDEVSVLVHRAQADDEEAFATLLGVLERKLYRQAVFLTGDEHQARDLIQETVLEAWNHLRRYDNRARFFTWLCGIMIHRHYDWLRYVRTRAFAFFSGAPDDSTPSDVSIPSEESAALDHARVLRGCLDELPARHRRVVYLRFYAGESIEGIAAMLRCSPGTVKSRLFHGLRRLAKMEKLKQLRTEM